jgi:ribonuclease P protein component
MTGNRGVGLRWITRSSQIRSARREGVFCKGENLLAWVSAGSGDESEPPAVGVVLRRGFEKAVNRNLLKRRLRGCVMETRDLLKPGYVYLFECKPGAELVDYQILVNEVKILISRVES